MRSFPQFAFILFVSSQLIVTAGAQTRLGSANLGSSTTATATITFSAAGTLSKIGVVTQGASGLDFTAAGTGTCKVGATYSTGQTCTVGVNFKPRFAGARYGAVILHSTSSLLATGFLQGNGVGPQIVFNPSPTTAIDPPITAGAGATGLNSPTGVAVDVAGNLYITSSHLLGVVLVPANGGAPSIFDPSAGHAPGENITSIAVDGAGNLFFLDVSDFRVVEVRPDGSTVEFLDPSPSAEGLAVDGAGDLFLVDGSTKNVIEYPGGNSQAAAIAISVTADGAPLQDPAGLAVDASGNLFIADLSSSQVVELTAAQVRAGGGNGILIAPVVDGKALIRPTGLAVDGAGNLFISDENNFRIIMVPASGAAAYAIQPTVNGAGLLFPYSLALDGAGNLFIADTSNNRVVRVQRSQAPKLTFAITSVGKVSTDSPQSVQVQNAGTGVLAITGLTYPADFPEHTGGANPCPTSISLSPGETCNLNIDFVPASTGDFAGDVTLTDNMLNENGTKQNVSVRGAGIEGQILLSATSLSYGLQVVDTTSASQQVTLTNNTASPLLITGIQVTGPNAIRFIFGNNCLASLPVGLSCIIHGHYAPYNPETDSAAVTITYRGGSSQTISLSGEGVFPPEAYLEETMLSFGTQQVGTQSASQYAKVVSLGGLPLHILGFQITGPNASSFIFGSDCPTYLFSPSYCHFHGHFAPTTTGPLKAFLTFTMANNAAPSPVTLTGTGTSQPTTISLSPTTLDFGTVNVGSSSASQRVSLTNKSVSVLDVAGISVTGANASSFVFANDCQPMVLVGKACSIHGHFTPTAKGPLTAVLTLTDSGVGSPQRITLKGTGQ